MRILALTEDASLAVALSELPFLHDVLAIGSVEQLEGHDLCFEIALVDLGNTRRGLVGASDVIRSGVIAPCLVVGDESPIELAVELAPDAGVLVRPFSLDELDARLVELAAVPRDLWQVDSETELRAERAGAERNPAGLQTRASPTEAAAADGWGDDIRREVEFGVREAEPLDPEKQARTESTLSVLAELVQLERFLDQVPEVIDRRAVAERLLEQVEHAMSPLVSVLWVPGEEGHYEALAARRLDGDERVPFDQSLFLSFETNLDAVLISQVDPLQRPVAGIPGIRGETLIAAALRVDEALQGVVMAAGTGYTEVERDQLQLLAVESAPAFAVAEVLERLRARLPVVIPPPAP